MKYKIQKYKDQTLKLSKVHLKKQSTNQRVKYKPGITRGKTGRKTHDGRWDREEHDGITEQTN